MSKYNEQSDPVADKMSEFKVFDPRINKRIVSSNPALLLGYLIETRIAQFALDDTFWLSVAKMANFCEKGKDYEKTTQGQENLQRIEEHNCSYDEL